jgi:hypothetical protein
LILPAELIITATAKKYENRFSKKFIDNYFDIALDNKPKTLKAFYLNK